MPDSQLNVTGAPRSAPSAVWTTDGGRTLNIVAQRPACTRLWANVLEQNPSMVRVAMVTYALRTLQACPLHIDQFTVTTKLDAPLGNRRIVFVDTKG